MNNERQMSIALLTTSYPRFEGDEASVFAGRLTDAYSEEGIKGIVVVPHDSEEPMQDTRGAFKIHRFRYGVFSKGALAFGNGILPNLRKKWWLIFQTPMLLLQMILIGFRERKQYQVIQANWIVTGIPALILKILTGKPYVLTLLGEDIKLLRSSLSWFLYPVLSGACKITTVSHGLATELKELFPKLDTEIQMIPFGVARYQSTSESRENFLRQFKLQDEWRLITYVGRVVPLKQPEVLIQTVAGISDNLVHAVIAGRIQDEYQRELLGLANSLGVQDRVHFLGTLHPDQVGELQSASYIYFSASTHEGRPNAVLEALVAGVPPCVSDIPGHRELVTDQENGMFFRLEQTEKAVQLILDLLENEEKYCQFSEAAIQSVREITWESTAHQYRRDVFESVHSG